MKDQVRKGNTAHGGQSAATPAVAGQQDTEVRFSSRRPMAPQRPKLDGIVAGLYCRVSLPHDTSIERQLDGGRRYVAQIGGRTVMEFADEAKTGKTVAGRSGLEAMMSAARMGHFNTLVAEDLSRVGRDGEDLERIAEELASLGILIHETRSGVLTPSAVSVKAVFAEEEHETLMRRSRAGRNTAVELGRRMAAPAFGFCRDAVDRKRHVPHPVLAGVISRIFRELAGGVALPEVVDWLNGRVPTPGDWRSIGSGRRTIDEPYSRWTVPMLRKVARNPNHVGLVIDGRTEITRDPEDYRIIKRRTNDIDDCMRVFDDRITIVDRKTWLAVQSVVIPYHFKHKEQNAKPRRYFLLKKVFCGRCGGSAKLSGWNGFSYGCAHLKANGCLGTPQPPVPRLEQAVLGAIFRSGAIRPSDIEPSEPSRHLGGSDRDAKSEGVEEELAATDRELLRCFEAAQKAAGGAVLTSLREQVQRLQARRQELRSRTTAEHEAPMACDLDAEILEDALLGTVRLEPFDLSTGPHSDALSRIASLIDRVEMHGEGEAARIVIRLAARAPTDPPFSGGSELSVLLPPQSEDRAWLRAKDAVTVGSAFCHRPDASTERALADARSTHRHGIGALRLDAVAQCVRGSRAIDVALRLGTDERNVMAWLHVFREHGAAALASWPSDGTTGGLDQPLVGSVCAEVRRWGCGLDKTKRRHSYVLERFLSGEDEFEMARTMDSDIWSIVRRLGSFEFQGLVLPPFRRGPRSSLTEEHIAFLRNLAEGGVDPEDSSKPVNWHVLRRELKRRFGLDYSKHHLGVVARGLGITLPRGTSLPTSTKLGHLVERLIEVVDCELPGEPVLEARIEVPSVSPDHLLLHASQLRITLRDGMA